MNNGLNGTTRPAEVERENCLCCFVYLFSFFLRVRGNIRYTLILGRQKHFWGERELYILHCLKKRKKEQFYIHRASIYFNSCFFFIFELHVQDSRVSLWRIKSEWAGINSTIQAGVSKTSTLTEFLLRQRRLFVFFFLPRRRESARNIGTCVDALVKASADSWR